MKALNQILTKVSEFEQLLAAMERRDTIEEELARLAKAAEEERNNKLERERELRVFIAMIKVNCFMIGVVLTGQDTICNTTRHTICPDRHHISD